MDIDKTYCKHVLFSDLPAPLTRMSMDVMSDGRLACKRYAVGISYDLLHYQRTVSYKRSVMHNAMKQMHNKFVEDNVQSINKQSFKITSNDIGKVWTIAIDAYIINDDLAEGGIFYERNETYAQLV